MSSSDAPNKASVDESAVQGTDSLGPREAEINWKEVAEARAETLQGLAVRYNLYALAIRSAVDILANRGRFGSPDDALDHLRRAQSATQIEADGDYPFWVKELADEQANGLRLLTALKRVYYEWDGEPEDMIHVQEAIAKAERLAGRTGSGAYTAEDGQLRDAALNPQAPIKSEEAKKLPPPDGGGPEPQCGYCARRFWTADELATHVHSDHGGPKPRAALKSEEG